jgi:hypothetical protein
MTPVRALVAALALALAATGIFLYVAWWRPNAHLRDVEWMEHAGRTRLLAESRKVLRLPMGMHHDACLFLRDWGGEESVPDLITALRWLPDTAAPGEFMSCEKVHCLDALQRITGADPGDNHRDWQAWWRANRRGR